MDVYCFQQEASVVNADHVAEDVKQALPSLTSISQRVHGIFESVSYKRGSRRIAVFISFNREEKEP
jgi:hypothetical protein